MPAQNLTSAALGPATASLVGGATTAIAAVNEGRNGLLVTVDTAAPSASPLYLLLGPGTASATNFHIALGPGGSWSGQVGNVTWRGAVQAFSAGTPKYGVVEV